MKNDTRQRGNKRPGPRLFEPNQNAGIFIERKQVEPILCSHISVHATYTNSQNTQVQWCVIL